ncbi:hypothetical protein V6N11_001704 [Hibiscus sabdariffa]|uniref:Uncharacterized protein n=1 Tax=Hibiscus sabdariffa TaxID=183260 RepID=A0ABR2NRF1_9ROSI
MTFALSEVNLISGSTVMSLRANTMPSMAKIALSYLNSLSDTKWAYSKCLNYNVLTWIIGYCTSRGITRVLVELVSSVDIKEHMHLRAIVET